MIEGWHGDNYLVLFQDEAHSLEKAYGIGELLPGYELLGLKGWDDFIVRNAEGEMFTVPTVPTDAARLEPFSLTNGASNLIADPRFAGRVKWYVQPIVFGGDPKLGPNVTWVPIQKHAELVQWWNKKYREVKSRGHSS